MSRHIVLVGLSGSGKSSAGRETARLLGCAFRDLDEDVSRRSGMTIPELFRREGEAAFRMLEREAMTDALSAPAHVVAAGGGWAAEPGNLEQVIDRTLIVYLRCTPETAAARVAGAGDRPLLAAGALQALRAQLGARSGWYERAHAVIDTDGRDIEDVARAVAALARTSGGW